MWLFRVAVACGLRFKGLVIWASKRMAEPSSWASLAALLTFYGMNVDKETCDGIEGFCLEHETWQAIIGAGVGVSGLLAVIMKEKPEQTIENKQEIKTYQEYPTQKR